MLCGFSAGYCVFYLELTSFWSFQDRPHGPLVKQYSDTMVLSIVSIDVSCSILGIIYDIIKISDISSKLITFATFYIDFSKISEKASFV